MKKKSTYIFLIITFLFIILTNILYKHFYNGISYSGYYKDDAEFYSTVLRQLDPNNSEQVEEYVLPFPPQSGHVVLVINDPSIVLCSLVTTPLP